VSLEARVEAILFASDRPLAPDAIHRLLVEDGAAREGGGLEVSDIRETLRLLAAEHERRAGGFHLVEVAGGYEFRTREAYSEDILRLQNRRPAKLSQSALETLSIVAYRQPCTRALVDQIRGVDSSSSVRTLLERNLVSLAGRSEEPGRPHLYRTTPTFLRVFGLQSLRDLPDVHELEELRQGHLFQLEEQEREE
jgi:segregation and condensation protein B